MAKPLAKILAFPKKAEVLQFPIAKKCGCGCGILLNEKEDSFIKVDSVGKWYTDEVCMLAGLDVIERNGYYKVRHTDYWYTKKEFNEDYQAYWVNEYAPIA